MVKIMVLRKMKVIKFSSVFKCQFSVTAMSFVSPF